MADAAELAESAMTLEVRPAGHHDLLALVALYGVVQSLHAKLDATYFMPELDGDAVSALFVAAIEADDAHVLVADQGSEAVGYVWMEIQHRPETAFSPSRCRTYVHHLAVREDARRSGVASALMRGVEEISRAAGVDRIVLDVWATNDLAHGYFAA